MGGYEDDLSRWLRDVDKRERDAERRHKELLEVHRRGYDTIAQAISESFKVFTDTFIDETRAQRR